MTSAAWSVRPALPRDLDAILTLERATIEAPHWSRSVYDSILAPPADPLLIRHVFVATAADRLFGFSVGTVSGEGPHRHGELENLVVDPAARRQGIGRSLCQTVLDWCQAHCATAVTLEVRSLSTAPIALYQGIGFKIDGRRPRYYTDPPDSALLMRRDLRREC